MYSGLDYSLLQWMTCSTVVVTVMVLLWKFKNDMCPCVGRGSKQAMMSLQQENQRLRQELNQLKMNSSNRFSQSHFGQQPLPLYSCSVLLVYLQVVTLYQVCQMAWEGCCPPLNQEEDASKAPILSPPPPQHSLHPSHSRWGSTTLISMMSLLYLPAAQHITSDPNDPNWGPISSPSLSHSASVHCPILQNQQICKASRHCYTG